MVPPRLDSVAAASMASLSMFGASLTCRLILVDESSRQRLSDSAVEAGCRRADRCILSECTVQQRSQQRCIWLLLGYACLLHAQCVLGL